ncbi:MAG TPA: sigma-70 family RNA polymerase sigma factor [Xanthomonadales bacterium]|nr:sigma-70 family RNA polymerase sigma factor [Xanthomonadales bacterium]
MGYALAMRDLKDEHLMRQYASGDLRAFEELYARYRGPLYRYFRRQVPDEPSANDLYQGCWEKIIAARRRYRPRAPFRAWLFRIAHNHAMDYHRRRKPDSADVVEHLQDGNPGPEGLLESAAQGERLMTALAALPLEQKDALLLRFESGLGLDDIGKLTGVARETVKSRLRYATQKLKQALAT